MMIAIAVPQEKSIEYKRQVLPEDLMHFRFVEQPCVSPDGNSILFTVTSARDTDSYKTQIWRYSHDALRLLTEEEGSCSNLSWSPDGSRFIYVTAALDQGNRPSSKLWLAEPTEGKKQCILEIPERRIRNPKWAPDSDSILFISDYDTKPALKSDVKVISRLQYRYDGEGFFQGRRPHIFKVAVESGSITRLTEGDFDVNSFGISPNGKQIVFVSNLSETSDYEVNQNLYLLSDKRVIEKITEWKGPIDSLSFSPDGQYIAFIGHDYKHKYNTGENVHVLNLKDRTIGVATDSLDRPTINSINTDVIHRSSAEPPLWFPDSQSLLFIATDRGRCHVYSVNTISRKIDQITKGDFVVNAFSLGGGKIAFTRMDPTHLPELFAIDVGGQSQRKLTSFNDSLVLQLELSVPERFSFRARDGEDVEGWFYRPTRANNGAVPCVVEIHGGGSTEGYEFMHEFQCLCSQGFAVLTCNFRGTRGYDQDFVSAINGHYMEKDHEDIIDMVNFAIEKGWIDPHQLGVAGGSYGGWLTSWLVSHEPYKFVAAVADRSVVNLNSFYGTSDDYKTFEHTILGCLPWENPSIYFEKSVLTHTQNIITPLLIIHSEEDYICPISEAEQLFAYLKRQGKEVLFVRFPHEGHGLSRYGIPHHRVERLGFYLWWFTSHIVTGFSYQRPA